MPRYTVNVSGSGWFTITADDDEDAATVAEELLSHGGHRLVGVELEDVRVDSIEKDAD
jgi:hypothetical protein